MVRVLEADPDLALALDPGDWQKAMHAAIAPLFRHPPGAWKFSPAPDPGALGTLILAGLIAVRIEAGERAHLELLGEGDVISPWASSGADLTLPTAVSARVLSELRLALLDRAFALRTARWPEIHAAVTQRMSTRSRRLSLQAAINAVPRVEERMELTLWQLAYRFGKVTRTGLKLSLPLSHNQLAEIVAAQRPSVTCALSGLERRGRLIRAGRDEWFLPAPEAGQLGPLTQQTGLRR